MDAAEDFQAASRERDTPESHRRARNNAKAIWLETWALTVDLLSDDRLDGRSWPCTEVVKAL